MDVADDKLEIGENGGKNRSSKGEISFLRADASCQAGIIAFPFIMTWKDFWKMVSPPGPESGAEDGEPPPYACVFNYLSQRKNHLYARLCVREHLRADILFLFQFLVFSVVEPEQLLENIFIVFPQAGGRHLRPV